VPSFDIASKPNRRTTVVRGFTVTDAMLNKSTYTLLTAVQYINTIMFLSKKGNKSVLFLITLQTLAFIFQRPRSQVSISSKKTVLSGGEELAQRIQSKCIDYMPTFKQGRTTFPVTTNTRHKLLLCPMCKLASTYWTRFFTLLKKFDNHTYITPFDIPLKDAPPTRERLTLNPGQNTPAYRQHYKFMFVRDPYSRILSAYIDKIFAPNPTFWNMISRNEIRRFRPSNAPRAACHSDLRFEEYIRAVITNHRPDSQRRKVDCHDESFISACHPCEVGYNFIGKMEIFSTDALHLYNRLHMNETINELQKHGKELADMDAMTDTVNSPFEWKKDIKKCIPWRQALNRVWRKLQIRGVIGKQQLPLNDEEAEAITKERFFDLIKKTQALTSYKERKQQRVDAMREIFASVPMEYLQELKTAYKEDFDLFEYNDDPGDIFHVNRSSLVHYGYLDLN